jgi:hypothetical protein
MNVQLLIDAVVRHTTALIAQLATAGGVRAPLAHVANQVFLALTTELEAQGVSRKVSADMFGMALRAYQKKIQRLSESSTVRGRSLWEAVLEYLEQSSVVTRAEVLQRFRNDDGVLVRGVLHDLVENGLVSCSGTGGHAVFRKTTDEERAALARNGMGLEEFLWVLIYREGPVSSETLAKLCGVKERELDGPLARLRGEQRILQEQDRWSAREFCVPLGSEAGWEAAMLDHYQALVRTLCARLSRLGERSSLSDATGGSTYTMHVWPGHPHEEEVVGTLGRVRRDLAELRRRVVAYNAEHRVPHEYESVVFYAGQSVLDETYCSEDQRGASDDELSQRS